MCLVVRPRGDISETLRRHLQKLFAGVVALDKLIDKSPTKLFYTPIRIPRLFFFTYYFLYIFSSEKSMKMPILKRSILFSYCWGFPFFSCILSIKHRYTPISRHFRLIKLIDILHKVINVWFLIICQMFRLK